VFCQLAYLRRCIPGRIRRALDDLPETLDETYARALKEIDKQNWEYAHRLFQCVAVASRPLRVKEVAEFLAFDFEAGPVPTFLADWRPEDPTHTVLSTCSSLLALVDDEDGVPVIQFAHFSVKEYLTSERLADTKDHISRFYIFMTAAHTIVVQACLGVLLHLDENITEKGLENFPLSKYAAEHWVDHARVENVSSNVQDAMKRLFDPSKRHLSIWVWIYDPEHFERKWGLPHPKRPGEAMASPLHYAAVCGLHDVATFLIVEHLQDVNSRIPNNETPLLAALGQGYVEITRILLKHGADTEARGCGYWSPLERATSEGHVELVQLLLKHGANMNAHEGENTPLYWASCWGKTEVARVFLRHGAGVNAQNDDNVTALHRANGEEITRLLLDHRAGASARDIKNRTPLHRAAEDGRVGTARVLLEHGADANARDANDATPLHLASCFKIRADRKCKENRENLSEEKLLEEHLKVLRLLLNHGSDIHARDDEGQTALHKAEGEEITRLLLEHGADVNARDANDATPLYLASCFRIKADWEYVKGNREELLEKLLEEHLKVLRLLLQHGSDIHARGEEGQTALHQAGGDEIARLLLEHRADANARDIKNRTPLHRALEDERLGTARVLLENGADANARDAHDATPLHLAPCPRALTEDLEDEDLHEVYKEYLEKYL